jgi:valyl-tRNA synthetase
MESPPAQQLPSAYDPGQVERRIYRRWLDGGYFTPKVDRSKQPFVIIQPPPNVTGELHLGHAQRSTVEDTLARWHRMLGEPTLWLPGVDHAGIATQFVVERELAAEGLTRHDLGRERFVERVWDWVARYRHHISEQHQRLGVSCDWSRERFTLDPGPSRAVRHTFVNLYRKGLIYQGERIINWCARCTTALSDLEVEHHDIQGNLYYIHYPLADGEGHVTVATTRPETLLGDTAVAVNPEDPRYRGLVGRNVLLPVLDRPIPIVADEAVDVGFGTGALKVTPGHDPTDFDLGARHGLPIINTMNLDGTMNAEAGPYQGMDRMAVREAIVADLESRGLLERVEPYAHSVGHCQRCDQVVEPLISTQWFVSVKPLAQPALEAVRSGEIRIIPDRFTRVYENWMENIRDWCISRQLWWGHRIPVWHCDDCGEKTVEYDDPTQCSACGSQRIQQDQDVLDTWFSSGLWPHSTLGWPDDTEDLDYFYPTAVMETAYEILFFWVARMIMLGLENTGRVPFHTVYLGGLVRDERGQKMSKTRGNVTDPLETIETYGCDALRFALTAGTAPGTDSRLRTARLETGRNFANKIWNAARYVMRALDEAEAGDVAGWARPTAEHLEDRWVLSRLNRLVARVARLMEDFQLGEAEQAIYDFLWDDYCDWFIEAAKVRLRGGRGPSPLPVLAHALEKTLRLLHPFMPFITEEVWTTLVSRLPSETEQPDSIMIAPYPEADTSLIDDQAEAHFSIVMALVRTVRNARAEFRIAPSQALEAVASPGELRGVLEAEAPAILALARLSDLRLIAEGEALPARGAVTAVVGSVPVAIPMGGLVDLAAERARLTKELEEGGEARSRLEGRLADQQFLGKAPEAVVERERERLGALGERQARLRELLGQLAD